LSAVWEIIQLANRSNIGLCLDTFQTAGGEWGDPTTESGRIESIPEFELQQRYKTSLSKLTEIIPKNKIFVLQISDAYKPDIPLSPEPDEEGLRPRGRWSHSFRPMPFNGGYLPIVPVVKAVLQTGFRGWFSAEIFDGGSDGKGKDVNDLDTLLSNIISGHRRLLMEATS